MVFFTYLPLDIPPRHGIHPLPPGHETDVHAARQLDVAAEIDGSDVERPSGGAHGDVDAAEGALLGVACFGADGGLEVVEHERYEGEVGGDGDADSAGAAAGAFGVWGGLEVR